MTTPVSYSTLVPNHVERPYNDKRTVSRTTGARGYVAGIRTPYLNGIYFLAFSGLYLSFQILQASGCQPAFLQSARPPSQGRASGGDQLQQHQELNR